MGSTCRVYMVAHAILLVAQCSNVAASVVRGIGGSYQRRRHNDLGNVRSERTNVRIGTHRPPWQTMAPRTVTPTHVISRVTLPTIHHPTSHYAPLQLFSVLLGNPCVLSFLRRPAPPNRSFNTYTGTVPTYTCVPADIVC